MKRIDCPKPTDLHEALILMPSDFEDSLFERARRISKEYRGILSPDDLVSEWYLWLARNPGRTVSWWYVDQETSEEVFNYWAFKRDIAKAMAARCRSERNTMLGYHDEDDVVYELSDVKDLLVWCWHTSDILGQTGDDIKVRKTNDPSIGMNMPASVADVRKAYSATIIKDGHWDRALEAVHRFGLTTREYSEKSGVPRRTARDRLTNAYGAILDYLNAPRHEPHEGPGARKAISNASAQAQTSREYM